MGLGELGTQIIFEDGREATVIYNGLCGVGIKWGLHNPDPKDFEYTGAEFGGDVPEDWPWEPDAILREPYDGVSYECEGGDFEVTRFGLDRIVG